MSSAYLDHAASTPMRPAVVAAMADVHAQTYGNPSGSHGWARQARRLLDDARDQIAAHLGVGPGDVIFTSGGTEADNLAVFGVAEATGGNVVCSATEHHAVTDPVAHLGGATLATDSAGRLTGPTLEQALENDRHISLVSAMVANNETGVITDIAELAMVVSEARPDHGAGLFLHVDAVAAAAWMDLAEAAAGADLISISGHKVGGPKGIGALAVRGPVPLSARVRGGGQERERRSGTPNVAGAVGLALALEMAAADRSDRVARVGTQRDRLTAALVDLGPAIRETVSAADTARLANIAHLCLRDIDGEAMLFLLERSEVAASGGSSCASGAAQPSHVLAAMGIDETWSKGALRLSLGWNTTDAELEHAGATISASLAQLQGAMR